MIKSILTSPTGFGSAEDDQQRLVYFNQIAAAINDFDHGVDLDVNVGGLIVLRRGSYRGRIAALHIDDGGIDLYVSEQHITTFGSQEYPPQVVAGMLLLAILKNGAV